MKDYLEVNKGAFNKLAREYDKRWRKYLEHQETVLSPFVNKLKKDFKTPTKVLDVGCGVGLDSYILTGCGFQVCGIDNAKRMIKYAKKNVSGGNFGEYEFLTYLEGPFHGLVMDAFLHLFPKEAVPAILNKVKSLLVPGGYGLICTTESEVSTEGYFEKTDYNRKVKRFRKYWTKKELLETLKSNGFFIADFFTDHEQVFDKLWMNVVIRVGDK